MQIQCCDVIGCGRPASWRRVGDTKRLGEEFLCPVCWMLQQCRNKPHAAFCYLPYAAFGVALLVVLEENSRQEASDDVVTIGA